MQIYKINEMSKKLGVSIKTLQRWDTSGKLKAKRTPTGRRYYTEDQYLSYMGIDPDKPKRKHIAYARVSSRNQKDDLKNQLDLIKNYTNHHGIIIDEYIEDIGSGLNYNRPKWNNLLESVMKDEIDTIYITYKDRFIRFGYEWFDRLCESHGTQIVILNDVESSPQKELVDDLTSIIHAFSCRLYGLRKYKQTIKNDKEVVSDETEPTSSTVSHRTDETIS